MRSWPVPAVPSLPGRGPRVHLHDTSLGEVVPVGPEEGTATLYVCGITPYDATHLGHANTYVAFDLLGRAWRDAGLDVRYVQNVTDVDDPLLERATATGVDWRDLAASQIDLFRADMEALSVVPPQEYLGVVEAVDLVSAAVRDLLAAGAAYRVPGVDGGPDGDVYFPVASDVAFGEVGGYDRETMLALSAERGGDPQRPGKRDPLDPLLWRVEREGEPAWDAGDLGRGRPGWHVECTAIALEHLGMPIDVQAGGSDLVFPHHEMGASHAHLLRPESRPFARAYAHSGMVAFDGEKMSKSKGNLVLVSKLRAAGSSPAPCGSRSSRTTGAASGSGPTRSSPRRASGSRRGAPPSPARPVRPRTSCWRRCANASPTTSTPPGPSQPSTRGWVGRATATTPGPRPWSATWSPRCSGWNSPASRRTCRPAPPPGRAGRCRT